MVKVYCVETQMKLVPPSYLVGGVLFRLLYLLCSLSVISSGRLRAGLPQPRASVCESESEEWPEILTTCRDFFGANSVKMRKWMKLSLKNLRNFLNHRPSFSWGFSLPSHVLEGNTVGHKQSRRFLEGIGIISLRRYWVD